MVNLKPNKRGIGYQAEQLACNYLQQQGLLLEQANYYCKTGEIDLIMRDQATTMVFVEVRARADDDLQHCLESITYSKQRKILRSAQHYLQSKQLTDKVPCRFDVIAITMHNQQPKIHWYKNAFHA
jgi:putative endonuclease